ncbi:MAG: hypothetical protein ABIS50_02795 [Luteolibacter sp.]|uniref:hypothetical protein n=1 Tax=Luteolibacter sp. TaxID=1962973 RepID=UPI003262D409
MTDSPTRLRKLANSPEWVFNWRTRGSPLIPKIIALVVAGTAFTLLVTTVRIRLVLPEKSSLQKASLIYLGDDAQSRALTLRAREGGPFPSRFELSSWEGLAEVERKAMDAARYQPPAYVPEIRDLPDENLVQPLVLAPRGEAFFPKRKPAADGTPELPKVKLAPVLYPLSAMAVKALPENLPAFDGAVDGKLSSPSWRFLVCLNAAGGVTECVSLGKGGEVAADTLEAWLHRVAFKPEAGVPVRWIALSVGFINQPVDGPDAR